MNSKLREALENSNELLEELALIGEWGESARGQISENKEALVEPLRNCDVGTAEEQLVRFREFCLPRKCSECQLYVDNEFFQCGVRWSQMPYNKEVKK